MERAIRILDLDGSVARQNRLREKYGAEIINMTDIGPKARFWASGATGREIRRRVRTSNKHVVTFLGSGDFHHVSAMLINMFEEPLSVIDLDLHADWNILGPRSCCGSWVREINNYVNVRKVAVIGADPGKTLSFTAQTGGYDLLVSGKTAVYPVTRAASKIFFRKIPPGATCLAGKGACHTQFNWKTVERGNLGDFIKGIIKELPTERVYITVDKDCLTKKYALTNWQEGELDLDELLLILRTIKENADIAGVDITGDYSVVHLDGAVKKIVSSMNRPVDFSAKNISPNIITRVNEGTNIKIMETLSR